MSLHIAILYGSVREARAGSRPVASRRGIAPTQSRTSVIDPAEYRLPLLDVQGIRARRGAPRVLEQLADIYRRSDAFAIVSGEY